MMGKKPKRPRGICFGGKSCGSLKTALPVTVALVVVSAVTAVLWYSELTTFGNRLNPVFFYLLPIALVTIVYGSYPALLCVSRRRHAPTIFSTTQSTASTSPTRVEAGDLACFTFLALIGVKCASELFWRSAEMPAPKSRYGSS